VINKDTALHLRKLSELYVQIGLLEKLLRVAIPVSLSMKGRKVGANEWVSVLYLDQNARAKLNQARIQQRKAGESSSFSIAEFLPLSFWSWIISRRHYTSLWIPHTHQISFDIENSQSFIYFKEFEERLHSATVDRNFVAHYNLSRITSLEESLENVRWLQEAMGLVKAE
jgi:hypothetical protein